jgi:hypothetical protein
MTKRERTKCAKAEMWLLAAVSVQRWTEYAPFRDHAPDDPLDEIAVKYDLSDADMIRLLNSVAQQCENRAIASGYGESDR